MSIDKHAAALIRGCEAGAYELPDDLLRARGAVERLEQAAATPLPDPDAVRREYERDVLNAARAGRPLPAPTRVTKAEDAVRAGSVAQEAVAAALEQARSELTVRCRAADTIICGPLRAAHDEVVAALDELVPQLEGVDSDDAAAAAGPAVRAAWEAMAPLADRYDLIRRAHTAVYAGTPVSDPVDGGEFASMTNIEQLWPAYRRRRGPFPQSPPWPSGPTRSWLAWVVAHGARLSLLSLAEREALSLTKYAAHRERLAAAQRSADYLDGATVTDTPPPSRSSAPRFPAFVRPGAGDDGAGAASGREAFAARLEGALSADPPPAAA